MYYAPLLYSIRSASSFNAAMVGKTDLTLRKIKAPKEDKMALAV